MTFNSREIIQEIRTDFEKMIDFVMGEEAQTATADQIERGLFSLLLTLGAKLLGLIIMFLVPPGMPLLLVIDETLERRQGKKIKYKGWFRDPIQSTARHVVTTLGLRWICLAVLVPVPWSKRTWSLPFMTVLAPGEKTSAKLNKRHRTLVQWAEYMIDKVRRWQPDREIMLVGDGSYAAIVLVQRCQRLKKPRQTGLSSASRCPLV